MQPFLSGETTLALLLITLTLLLFAAAGDEHPYEPYHRKFPVEAGRSSVEIAGEQPQIRGEELVVRLEGLKEQSGQQGGQDQRVVGREQRKTEVVRRGISQVPVPRNSKPSSYLPSRFRPRNLQILAALLSHQSLHTMSMPVLKSDLSWSLGGGLGLPLMKTVRGRSLRSLRCRGKVEVRGTEYVTGGDDARRGRSEDDRGTTGNGRVSERVVEVVEVGD